MNHLWYRGYDTADYWQFVEHHDSAEQTAVEVAHLQQILEDLSPGPRVVDLGCGLGRHAIGLAQAGFQVTGFDVSAWAIDEARRRGAETGFDIRWNVVDLLKEEDWPLSTVDAAICVSAFGWGTDADQRRLLRRIRRNLAPGGIFILALPPLHQVVGDLKVSETTVIKGKTYTLQQTYDSVNGRLRDSLTVSGNARTQKVYTFDCRLYATTELVSLLRETGFVVEHSVPEFAPAADTRLIYLCARPLPTPPTSLAVTSWRTPPDERLDLRYAPDEAVLLQPTPDAVWRAVIDNETRQGAEAVGFYPVNDPYGSERAAAVVSEYFDCAILPHQLALGPGVTSLLHDLCGLANRGLILGPQLVHPDLTAWGVARGCEAYFVPEPATVAQFEDVIRAKRPALVHLDRPRLYTGELISLDDLYVLGIEAARVGAAVLVDESPATYLGPSGSAVPLIHELDNLVILRGLTKAYSWGGLRVGFAYASDGISERVRELICPLQVGELAHRAALRLLAAGDIFHQLREVIRRRKPEMVYLLQLAGIEVIAGHPALPWVNVPDEGGKTSKRLDRLGIRGLRFVPSPALREPYPERLLLFSPLSEARMAELRRHLAIAEAPILQAAASDL